LNEKKLSLEEKLATNKFIVDSNPHIKINSKICETCKDRECLTVCPAGCFKLSESGHNIIFSFEGCLECGSCKFVCKPGSIEWDYPEGGFGICYRYG